MRRLTSAVAPLAATLVICLSSVGAAQESASGVRITPWAAAWGGYSGLSFRGRSETIVGGGATYGVAAGLRAGPAFVGVQRQGLYGFVSSEADAGASFGFVAGAELARSREAAVAAYAGATRETFRSTKRYRGRALEVGVIAEMLPRWAVSPLLVVARRWWTSGEEVGFDGAEGSVRMQQWVIGVGVSAR